MPGAPAGSAGSAAVLTPKLLAMIGRALVIRGEFACVIGVLGGRLAVHPAQCVDVQGRTPDPMGWTYRIDVPTPSGLIAGTREAGEVFHVRYGEIAADSWHGRSPLTSSRRDLSALASLMAAIDSEAAKPTGTLGLTGGTLTEPQSVEFNKNVGNLRGHTRLAFTGREASSLGRFRVGFQPEPEARQWAADLTSSVYSACGIPGGLFAIGGDGTASREAWRRLTVSTVHQIGQLVAAEAEAKPELPVALSFERLRGADAQSQARGYAALVQSGMSDPDALKTMNL